MSFVCLYRIVVAISYTDHYCVYACIKSTFNYLKSPTQVNCRYSNTSRLFATVSQACNYSDVICCSTKLVPGSQGPIQASDYL